MSVPIRYDRQAGGASLTVMMQVTTSSGDLWMQLDAGSDAPLVLPRSSAVALGLGASDAAGSVTLTPGVETNGLAVTARAAVKDMIFDGNIGQPVMKSWIMTFDLANDRLWLRRAER